MSNYPQLVPHGQSANPQQQQQQQQRPPQQRPMMYPQQQYYGNTPRPYSQRPPPPQLMFQQRPPVYRPMQPMGNQQQAFYGGRPPPRPNSQRPPPPPAKNQLDDRRMSTSSTHSISEDFQKQFHALKIENDNNLKKITSLQESDKSYNEKIVTQADTITRLEEELDVSILEISRLTQVVGHYEESQKEALGKLQQETSTEISHLTGQIEELTRTNQELSADLGKLSNVESILSETLKQLSTLEETHSKLANDFTAIKSENSELRVNYESSVESNQRLQNELSGVSEKFAKTESMLANSSGSSAQVVEDLQSRLQQAQESCKTFEDEVKKSKGEVASSLVEIERLKEENASLNTTINEAETVYEQLTGILNDDREKMAALESQYEMVIYELQRTEEQRQSQVDSLTSKLEVVQTSLEQSQQALIEGGADQYLYDQVQQLQYNMSQYTQNEVDLVKQYSLAREEASEAHRRLKQLMDEKSGEEQDSQVATALAEEAAFREKYDKLRADYDGMFNQMKQLEEAKDYELADLKMQFDGLVQKNFELMSQLAATGVSKS